MNIVTKKIMLVNRKHLQYNNYGGNEGGYYDKKASRRSCGS